MLQVNKNIYIAKINLLNGNNIKRSKIKSTKIIPKNFVALEEKLSFEFPQGFVCLVQNNSHQ